MKKKIYKYAALKEKYGNLRETLSKIDSDIKDSGMNPDSLNSDQEKQLEEMKKKILHASQQISVEELNEVFDPICDYAKSVAKEAEELAKAARKSAKRS
tara:strand:+ start:577 stop:873 length:297 start_codon:yes stop_codon:yes gene_type:complete